MWDEILGSEVWWCISGRYFGMGLQKCVVQFGELFPQIRKPGRVRWNLRVWGLVVYPGTLVQDVFAEMRGVIWRAVPAKVNQHPKVHHKTSNPKIWSCASLFWDLWEQFPKLHHTFLQTNPKITPRDDQRYAIKTSAPKISSHMFDLCQNGSPYYTAHFGKHILNFLNQLPKVHHKTSDPKIPFYASLFWDLWEQLPKLHHTFLQIHAKITSRDVPRYTIKTSDPKISSHKLQRGCDKFQYENFSNNVNIPQAVARVGP